MSFEEQNIQPAAELGPFQGCQPWKPPKMEMAAR